MIAAGVRKPRLGRAALRGLLRLVGRYALIFGVELTVLFGIAIVEMLVIRGHA